MSKRIVPSIVFYEAFDEEARVLQTLFKPEHHVRFTPKAIQESGDNELPSTLISIRTQSVIPPSWAPTLKGVLSRSTGYDHLVAFRERTSCAAALGYLEEYSTRAVAEHALLMVLALLRKLPLQVRQLPMFQRDGLTGVELKGRRVLVVGVGRIGGEIVRLASALGCDVKGVDIKPDNAGVTYVSKEMGIEWAEVIVCSMNLTRENTGYFSYDLLRRARQGTVFVNIARGEHAPLTHLGQLLAEGHLGAIGLDVFEDEALLAAALRDPAAHSSPFVPTLRKLLASPNVLFTPHNAFNTREALTRKCAMTVAQIEHFLKQGRFQWQIP